MITPEFGLLGTVQEQLWYKMLKELEKNNELLSQFLLKQEEEKEVMNNATVRRTRNKNSKGNE